MRNNPLSLLGSFCSLCTPQLAQSRRAFPLQRRRNMIDYRTEIPFQKLAPAGFHDTSEEIVASKNQKFDPVMLHRLEAERRCTSPESMRIHL